MNARIVVGLGIVAAALLCAFGDGETQVLTNATVGNGAATLGSPTPTPSPTATPSPTTTPTSLPTAAPSAMVYERQAPVFCDGTGSNTTCTATLATTPPAGDIIMFVAFGAVYSNDPAPTGITGMSQFGTFNSALNPWVIGWYKTATGSDSTTFHYTYDASGFNSEGILLDLANTSGAPALAEATPAWNATAKTITTPSLSVAAGSYVLAGADFSGLNGGYVPSSVSQAPLSVVGESVQQQFSGNYADFVWAHGIEPSAGTNTATIFGPSLVNSVYNQSSLPTVIVSVAAGGTSIAASPLPSPTAVAAVAADSLVNSEGVNTHLNEGSTVYENYLTTPAPNGDTVLSSLATLGVRHIRTFRDTNGTTYCPVYSSLSGEGVYSDFLVQSGDTAATFASAYGCAGSDLEAFEGINEPDSAGGTWYTSTYNEQQALSQARTAGTNFPLSVNLIGASVSAAAPGPRATLAAVTSGPGGSGAYSSYEDFENLHWYPGTVTNPDSAGVSPYIASYGDTYAILTEMNITAASGSTAPVMITELGFNTSSTYAPGPYVDNTSAAKYTVRAILQAFKNGSPRTYIYQLADDQAPTGWGLEDPYLNPFPAYTALENLNNILKDPGAPFTTTPLSVAFNAPSDFRDIVLQKRDGSFWLVYWVNDNSYDETTHTDVTPESESVTAYLGAVPSLLENFAISATTGAVTTSTPSVSRIVSLTATDMPQVLQIGSVSSEPSLATPQPPNCSGTTPCP